MTRPYPPIIKRRVNIDFSSAHPSGWMPEDGDYESVLNAISCLFPAGESYFIRSVKYYMDRIDDPELKERARRFIYQETMHSREHARANNFVAESNPHVRVMEKVAVSLLTLSRRINPPSMQLATTCALEHFTAMFAHVLLRRQDEFIAQTDQAFATLWLWHAVEETEHKAVCFDVYEHVCGKGIFSYLRRSLAMLSVSIVFVLGLAVGFTIIKYKKKMQQRAHGNKRSRELGKKSPGFAKISKLFKGVAPSLYFDYYRRSFHPWDHDNRDLIERWKNKHSDLEIFPHAEPTQT